ncbi:MAG: peptidoglycan-associated lipoprotein Pal [Gammaproteobacteria bacterium]|nr:peptidoglycan-associated lipoprotein Pal [Gammaproteobacteria bacterium]
MKQIQLFAIILLGAVLTSACQSTPEKGAGEGADGVGSGGQDGSQIEGRGAELGGGISTYSLEDPDSPLSKRVIYFDYDSASIKQEYRDIIEIHAQYLADHPDTQLVLEGHTDERGSREYNIALGERRANSVKKIMQLFGVTDAQLQTVSFGEERPVAPGHDETAWALNRRVELLYSEHR